MIRISIYLLIAICFISCNNGSNSRINGDWRTKDEFNGIPKTILTIKTNKESVFVHLDPKGSRAYMSGFGDNDKKDYTGKYLDNNKFELGNGLILEYNEDLDLVYLKSQLGGGQEFSRYESNSPTPSTTTTTFQVKEEKKLTKQEKQIDENQGEPTTVGAIIVDPDGFTNVREERSAKSKIIEKVFENEKFEVYTDDELDANWWFVYIPKSGNSGYIHKSRVKLLN